MKLRANREIERAGVNAARTLLESCGCVFQEVDGANDYGKDAYVDLGQSGYVTGACLALQIKSGKSYRAGSDYAIPVDEKHESVWRDSSVPTIGIVYDPDLQKLFWCSITRYLSENTLGEIKTIPVSSGNELTREAVLNGCFRDSTCVATDALLGQAILRLGSDDPQTQCAALYDCFCLGRNDARVFVLVRRMMSFFDEESYHSAVIVLSHLTSHPDIFWTARNWVPQDVRDEAVKALRWNCAEAAHLLRSVGFDEWARGRLGQCVFMLLIQDPDIQQTLGVVSVDATRAGDDDVAYWAAYLAIYLAYDEGPQEYNRLLELEPAIRNLPFMGEVAIILRDYGQLLLFE
jgi:hypothetical protein